MKWNCSQTAKRQVQITEKFMERRKRNKSRSQRKKKRVFLFVCFNLRIRKQEHVCRSRERKVYKR